MEETKKFKIERIIYIFSIVYYLAIGIFVFIIFNQNFAENVNFLGTLIILSSVPHLLIYFIDRRRLTYLIIGLVGLAFGILFIATEQFDPDQVCMVWGCIDICRGSTEIISIVPHLRKHKIEWIEIAISLGDIIIGTLLIIHMAGGIKLHLIYLAIEFVISGGKNIFEFVYERFHHEGSNNN